MTPKEQENTENQVLIFDFDGTLADTFSAHYRAWRDVLEAYSIRNPSSLLRHLLRRGLDSEKIARDLKIDEKFVPIIADEKRSVYSEIAVKRASLYPYAKQAIQTLYERGYILCILTTTDRNTVENILLRYNLRRYFSLIVGREDSRYPKPHPQSIYRVFQKLEGLGKEDSAQIFYIGDSETDSALCKATDISFILFLSPYQGNGISLTWTNVEHALIIRSLKELLNIFPPLRKKGGTR